MGKSPMRSYLHQRLGASDGGQKQPLCLEGAHFEKEIIWAQYLLLKCSEDEA